MPFQFVSESTSESRIGNAMKTRNPITHGDAKRNPARSSPRAFVRAGPLRKSHAIAASTPPASAVPMVANTLQRTGCGFTPPGTKRTCASHFSLNCWIACGIVRSPVLRPWSIVEPRICSKVGSAGQPITTDPGIASR